MEKVRRFALPAAAFAILLGAALGSRVLLRRRAPPRDETSFNGHYGYAFRVSPATAKRMRLFGAFTNAEKTSEVVFVFPREMREDEPFSISEALYQKLGLVRMEVNPNRNFPVSDGEILGAARYAIAATLKEKREEFTVVDAPASLPGFAVDISSPTSLRQVFLKGRKVHYLLTGAPDNPVLGEVLSTLVEIEPHDRPGS